MDLADAVAFYAELKPESLALACNESSLPNVTFRELQELIARCTQLLQQESVHPDRLVCLGFDDPVLMLVSLGAVQALGGASFLILSTQEDAVPPGALLVTDRARIGAASDRITVSPAVLFKQFANISTASRPRGAAAFSFSLDGRKASPVAASPSFGVRFQKCIGDFNPPCWTVAANVRDRAGLFVVLDRLCSGCALLLASDAYEEDIQLMGLLGSTCLIMQSDRAAGYLSAISRGVGGLSSGLHRAVFVGARFDRELISLARRRLCSDIVLVLSNGLWGPVACRTAVSDDRGFRILPGVELESRGDAVLAYSARDHGDSVVLDGQPEFASDRHIRLTAGQDT